MFAGWDWASTAHDVTVIDVAGKIVDRWAPEHTEAGLDQTLTRLARHGRPDKLPVAIERPSGLVVDWSWIGCWRPATRSFRSTPTRSTPAGPAGRGGGQI